MSTWPWGGYLAFGFVVVLLSVRFPAVGWPLVVGLSVASFFVHRLSRRLKGAFSQGRALYEQGKFAEALAAFSRAGAQVPDQPMFEYFRAQTLLQLLRLQDAELSFARAHALHGQARLHEVYAPQAELVLALQGKPVFATGDLSRAERVLARAVELVRNRSWQSALDHLAHPSLQQLSGMTRVLKEALTAWCLKVLGKENRTLDLSLLRQPGVADVATFWPELARFLESL